MNDRKRIKKRNEAGLRLAETSLIIITHLYWPEPLTNNFLNNVGKQISKY